jgi:VanZ family protein
MRWIRGYWKSILVGIGILYVSLVRAPGINLPSLSGDDKWVHLVMYSILGCVLSWDSWKMQLEGWRLWMITMVIPIAYGGIIELVQEQWFAPRSGEWMDWGADCIGVLAGAIALMIIRRSYNKRHA